MQLFCFTFAGGTAAFYDQLDPYFDNTIDIIKLEYAGHGIRYREGFYEDFTELAEDMYRCIKELIHMNTPYALIGYSMGSISLVEVLKLIITRKELPLPEHVFLAAYSPKTKRELVGCQTEDSDGFVKKLMISFGGIPEKLIENNSFWRMYLPFYRNDYSIVRKYKFEDLFLNTMVPATVFYSETDTSLDDMKKWGRYFIGNTQYVCYEGKHFLFRSIVKIYVVEFSDN